MINLNLPDRNSSGSSSGPEPTDPVLIRKKPAKNTEHSLSGSECN